VLAFSVLIISFSSTLMWRSGTSTNRSSPMLTCRPTVAPFNGIAISRPDPLHGLDFLPELLVLEVSHLFPIQLD